METSGGSNSLKAKEKGEEGRLQQVAFLVLKTFQNTFSVSDVFFSDPNFECDISGIKGCSFEE